MRKKRQIKQMKKQARNDKKKGEWMEGKRKDGLNEWQKKNK